MVFLNLALFVVSFLVTALLAPRPDLENARASNLDDVNFPMASENAPAPIILGRVRHRGLNTIYYGGFRTEAITERIRVSIFKKETVVVGHRYYLTLDMGVGLGPDIVLREVYIDEEQVWTGDTTGNATTAINISAPELFGGYKSGGGWVSAGTFYSGSFTQPVDAAVEALVGAGQVPAYRGTSHFVFNDAYIGESANLRNMALIVEQYTNDLLLANNGKVGIDMNPAEALYQILVDDWYGLNIPPSQLNIPSFQAAGATLLSEGNGASIIVTSESDGRRLVTELLRQMDAIMYQDPTTGEIHLDLIRADYVIGDLLVLDEADIIEVKSFTKTTWDEVFSQTKVTFQQRDSDSSAVAISQDMATFNTIGRLKTQTLSFPFVYDATLANNIASRERAQSSVPLFRATLEVNRVANQLRPGSVFVFNFAQYGISQLVMRVQRFDLGSLTDGKMVVEAIQDNFALQDTVFAAPPPTSWVDVVYGPANIVLEKFIQTPRFMAAKGELAIPREFYGITPLAARPSAASTAYTLHVQAPDDATVDDGTTEPVDVLYGGSGLLTTEYPETAGFVTGQDTLTGLSLNSVSGSFAANTQTQIKDEFLGLIQINDEFMAYEVATDNGGDTWTLTNIWRGLLGTRPATHAVNSRVYSVNPAAFGRGIEQFIPDGTSYSLRMLDVSAGITQDPNFQSATAFSVADAASNVNASPIRPGNLQLGGVRELTPVIDDQVDRDLTWVTRSFDGSQIAFETDAAEALPHSESYAIDVFVNGIVNAPLSGTVGAGVTTYTVPFSSVALNSTDVMIRVTPTDVTNSFTGLEYSWYRVELNQISGPTLPFAQGFDATGADQTYIIPAGITTIEFAILAGGGGSGTFTAGLRGGGGGYTEGSLTVAPGDTLTLQVGEGGQGGQASAGGTGGWPDGGGGANGDTRTGGGGGSSRLWHNGTLVAVAGAGGGDGGFIGSGGGGGGTTGQNATTADGGSGGSQIAGGVDQDDTGNANKTGVQLTSIVPARTGGWGATTGDTTTFTADDGGGGGGGYYGGGGGGGDGRSGGGGSGHVAPAATSGTTFQASGPTPPTQATGLPDIPANRGGGGTSGSSAPARDGQDGWIGIYHNAP